MYQINAQSVRVLSESEEPVEERPIPSLPIVKTFSSQRPCTPPLKSFDTFVSPKKAKMMD
jgi:hypothetical protein